MFYFKDLETPIRLSEEVRLFIDKVIHNTNDRESLAYWTRIYGLGYLAECSGVRMPRDEYGTYGRMIPEVENALLTCSPISLWNYMVVRKRWFRHHRWAEAESVFLAIPYYAANYANTFMQARWPAFEGLLRLDYHGRAKTYAALYESAMVAIEQGIITRHPDDRELPEIGL